MNPDFWIKGEYPGEHTLKPMEGLHEAGPRPFLTKTFEMVDDFQTKHIVIWSRGGHSFVVWDSNAFASKILPIYFKHHNFSSFVRQLNTYFRSQPELTFQSLLSPSIPTLPRALGTKDGWNEARYRRQNPSLMLMSGRGFKKIDSDKWEFANEHFVKAHEVLHFLNRHRSGKHCFMALKLDMAKALDRLSSEAERGTFKDTRIAKDGPQLTHLLFADDLLILCKAEMSQANKILHILQDYSHFTCQRVNIEKSSIYFSRNTTPDVQDRCCQILNVFTMSCFLLPVGLFKEISSACAGFWWSKGDNTQRGIHWKAWDQMTLPKPQGSLGFQDIQIFNEALIAKQIWRLLTQPQLWVSRIIKAKYYSDSSILAAERKVNASWLWNSWLKVRDNCAKWMQSVIHNGKEEDCSSIMQLNTFNPEHDEWVWNQDKKGNISISNTYALLIKQKILKMDQPQSSTSMLKDQKAWTRLWKLKVKVCGFDDETLEHALFNCPNAQLVWNLAPVNWEGPKEQDSFKDWWWQISELNKSETSEARIQLSTYILWWLWKCRNLSVFEGSKRPAPLIVEGSKRPAPLIVEGTVKEWTEYMEASRQSCMERRRQ
ncbi:heat stress transcription factor A-7b [Striga asiatica]|uniref:Heat stress transcription factor A-7b n=1 Tax=Striga asiatica TaxID=4170 RepID=A0A5A7RDA4_STRAF|nr:heat stress transcription factor A-7b [Striga asiatica]